MYINIKKEWIIYKLFFIVQSYLTRHKNKQVNNIKYILFYFFIEFMEVMTGGDDWSKCIIYFHFRFIYDYSKPSFVLQPISLI